jgi:outer membrane protein TolC
VCRPRRAGGCRARRPRAQAVAGRALRLVDVLDAALRANPTARASLAAAEAARAQAAAARGAFAPALTFAPGFLRSQTIPTALPPAAAGAVPRGLLNERTQFSPALGLNFLLLDFGGRAGLAAAARESANAAEATFDATVATTVLQAEQAYFDYQSARQVVEAQDENVRTAALNRDAAGGALPRRARHRGRHAAGGHAARAGAVELC